jgi:hypothetical protein
MPKSSPTFCATALAIERTHQTIAAINGIIEIRFPPVLLCASAPLRQFTLMRDAKPFRISPSPYR